MNVTIKNLATGIRVFPNMSNKNVVIQPNETRTFDIHPYHLKQVKRELALATNDKPPLIELVASEDDVVEETPPKKTTNGGGSEAKTTEAVGKVKTRAAGASKTQGQPKPAGATRGKTGAKGTSLPRVKLNK